jgi:hypothetical protein
MKRGDSSATVRGLAHVDVGEQGPFVERERGGGQERGEHETALAQQAVNEHHVRLSLGVRPHDHIQAAFARFEAVPRVVLAGLDADD